MKKFISLPIKFILLIILFLALSQTSLAASTACSQMYLNAYGQCATDCASLGGDFTAAPTNPCDSGQICCHKTFAQAAQLQLQVPLFDITNVTSLPQYIATIYRYSMIIIIPLAIVMIIVGGVRWIFAAGNQGQIKTAKQYITAAFSGLVIALFSYVLLNLVGISTLKQPEIAYLEPVIVNNETHDPPCDENNPTTEPRCKLPPGLSASAPTSFSDILLHSAQAKANVPWLHQKDYDINYGSCGTIATSGCGVTSLTMMLQFLGNKTVKVPDVAKMATDMEARDCPASLKTDCVTNKNDIRKNCNCCKGTRYSAFLSTKNDDLMKKYDKIVNPANFTSKILSDNGLIGEYVNYGDWKKILTYLSAQVPLIVSVKGVNRFTSAGHFIVLTGCDNCLTALDSSGKKITNNDMKIYLNDPYNDITVTTTGEILPLLQAVFYIHKPPPK